MNSTTKTCFVKHAWHLKGPPALLEDTHTHTQTLILILIWFFFKFKNIECVYLQILVIKLLLKFFYFIQGIKASRAYFLSMILENLYMFKGIRYKKLIFILYDFRKGIRNSFFILYDFRKVFTITLQLKKMPFNEI